MPSVYPIPATAREYNAAPNEESLMKRSLTVLIATLLASGALLYPPARGTTALAAHPSAARDVKKTCKFVTKKVHGHKKKVKVCSNKPPAHPAAPGLFDQPTGIAVDGRGNVFVSNWANDKVVKLSASGQPSATWTTFSSPPPIPPRPGGIALDAGGNAYVANGGMATITKLSPTGAILAQWGGNGTFDDPYSVALDSAGNIYVADYDGSRIAKLSSSGTQLTSLGSGIQGPMGIALDAQGRLYVTELGANDILQLSPNGTLLATWGASGSALMLKSPTGITLDSAGNVYVVDAGDSRIVKLSSTGQVLATWGTSGSAPGQFKLPTNLYYSDYGKGEYEGIAVDSANNIYVADTGNNRVQKLSPTGQVLAIWK